MSPLACPRNPADLRAVLEDALDVRVAPAPLLEGHDAPFDYLIHTFFEDKPPDSPRDAVVWAGRGSGKTFLGALATLLDLLFKPGIEVRILGGSLEQSRRMHEHLRALLAADAVRDLVAGRITDRRLRLTNGSTCEILAPTHTSVRGCRPQKLRFDEVELFTRDIWDAAQLATRSKVCGGRLVHGSVDALSTMHEPGGLMRDIVASASQGPAPGAVRRLFRWSVIDALETCPPERPCPACDLFPDCAGRAKQAQGHMPIDDAIQMKRRVSRSVWDAEMLCLRPRRDDLVLPEFNRDAHVADFPPPEKLEDALWIAGMDFGFRAPTAALFAFVDSQGAVRVIDERIARETTLDAHARALLQGKWPRPAWVGVDPAGRQRSLHTGTSAIAALRKAGLAVRDRRLPLHAGLRLIQRRLAPAAGPPALFFHSRCKTLIASIESYRYPRDRPWCADPIKDGADHAVDALRYMLINLDRDPPRRASYL